MTEQAQATEKRPTAYVAAELYRRLPHMFDQLGRMPGTWDMTEIKLVSFGAYNAANPFGAPWEFHLTAEGCTATNLYNGDEIIWPIAEINQVKEHGMEHHLFLSDGTTPVGVAVILPPYQIMPEVLCWGQRVFVWRESSQTYCEGLAVIPMRARGSDGTELPIA